MFKCFHLDVLFHAEYIYIYIYLYYSVPFLFGSLHLMFSCMALTLSLTVLDC